MKLLKTLIVIMVIVAILTGCGTKLIIPNSENTKKEVISSETESNFNPTGLPVLKEKKTFTIAVEKDPKSENSFGDKEASKMAERETNIHIEWMDIPSAGWSEQVNIMIASGNLPDAFSSVTGVDTMSNIELFTPLKKLIEDYAPNISAMLSTDINVRKAITAEDGDIYSLPTGKDSPTKLIGHSLWINPEWVKKLGLSMPKTTDEFTEVLRAFKMVTRTKTVFQMKSHFLQVLIPKKRQYFQCSVRLG